MKLKIKIFLLKRRAVWLMTPWVLRRENYECGAGLLMYMCPTEWLKYRKGVAYGRLARKIERKVNGE